LSEQRWTPAEIAAVAGILALALLLRVVRLEQVPPGMQHDEVFDARFATTILDGARPVFIDENTGVPPLFSYLVAGAFALLGRSLITLRLTSVAVGMLGLAVSYLLLRELLGRTIALLALAGLAVSFWHVFDSRVGIEPILVPLLAGLSFYLFWQAMRRGSLVWYGLAGLSMGLAQYGHRTGVLIPLTVAAFVAYLGVQRLFPSPLGRGETGLAPGPFPKGRGVGGEGIALMFLLTLLVSAPLIIHLATGPADSMLRVRQLSGDLNALFDGHPQAVLQDVVGVLGMFGLRGDPEWRYNVAGRPIFDPLTGLLFWAGVIVCLARWRRPANVFMLLWLSINLAAAAVTSPSPASTRALGSIAPIYAMPAVALVAGWERAGRRKAALAAVAGLLLAGNAAWSVRDYFFVWPANAEVREIYRADLALAARYLDSERPEGAVCISAQFAADLDRQTFDYTLRTERPIKWFDARQTLVLPALQAEMPLTYLYPITDPASAFARHFAAMVRPQVERIRDAAGDLALTVVRLNHDQLGRLRTEFLARPQQRLDINLGDEIDLLGYDLPAQIEAGQPIGLTVYWRVRRGGRGDLSYAFFAHVLDGRGFGWVQDDPLAFPPSSWWADDLVAQTFNLTLPADAPPGPYHVEIGFYEQNGGQRLAQVNADGSAGADAFTLEPFVATASAPPASEAIDAGEDVGAAFGGRIELLGYDIADRVLDLEERVEVAMTWRALLGGADDVEIELTLVSEDGQMLALPAHWLAGGAYPLDQWSAGQTIRDRFYLEHTPDIPRAVYELRAGVRDRQTGAALALPDGSTSVSLGQVFMRGMRP